MNATKTEARESAEDRYLTLHVESMSSLVRIEVHLQNLPAPGGHQKIGWPWVGTTSEVKSRLEAVATFLEAGQS